MQLVLLPHFPGSLDCWDPALVDALAQSRRVIAFDNAGVGDSTGTTPDTVDQMARDAIAFIAALGLSQVDLLGFSICGFVAQEVALAAGPGQAPHFASSAPKVAPRTYGLAVSAVGSGATFFAPTATSQQAGKEVLSRLFARTDDRDANTDLATVTAQFEAARVWSMPDHSALERLQALELPVLTANGDNGQRFHNRQGRLDRPGHGHGEGLPDRAIRWERRGLRGHRDVGRLHSNTVGLR